MKLGSVVRSAFLNGDTGTVVTAPILSTTATSTSVPGVYPINITQGTLAAANYTFHMVSGTMTVNKAVLTVAGKALVATYGGPIPSFNGQYTITGFVNGDTAGLVLTGTPALSTTAHQGSPAGAYPITVTLRTLAFKPGKANLYTLAFVPGTLTINKAVLRVTADNKTKQHGQPNPPLTYT